VHEEKLTGKVSGKIVDRAQKETIARTLAAEMGITMENVVAVGDGANDLDMINAAGIGIAFNAKGIVQRNSPCILNNDSIEYVKYFLG
jgi:phosphoserine phosphatase